MTSSPVRDLEPTPAQAREWLRKELFGSAYQGSWLDSVRRWVGDQLRRLLEGADHLGGLSPVVTILLALLVIALLVWVLPRVRREPVAAVSGGRVLDDMTVTARHYRELAARALRDGRYDDAVLDGFRAIAKDMSDRGVLDDAPGRTAHEVSLALASPFAGHATAIAQAADLFDSVRYGHRQATADQAGQVQQLDTELVRTGPVLVTSPLLDMSV